MRRHKFIAITTPKSSVAGIIDIYGGLRIIVAEYRYLFAHIEQGEHLFVVPDFKVHEPIPWNDIPYVIKRVESYIADWIRSRNDPDAITGPVQLYRLCCLKHPANKGSLDLASIVET